MTDPRGMAPNEALDALLEDAKHGCSDQWLADRADVSVRQVQLWKKARGLSSDKSPLQQSVDALAGLAMHYEPSRHQVESSISFEGPKYVVHEALDYTQYARACYELSAAHGFSLKQVCGATGTRVSDVETAIEMYRRHLGTVGAQCLGCSLLVDPRFSKFCSRSCHDRATK